MAIVKDAKDQNINSSSLFCHDCKTKIQLNDPEIKDGVALVYDDAGRKIKILKCGKCYRNNKRLSNFRNCEVYSRIVGYIRPVSQWNDGKSQEYKERKIFKKIT